MVTYDPRRPAEFSRKLRVLWIQDTELVVKQSAIWGAQPPRAKLLGGQSRHCFPQVKLALSPPWHLTAINEQACTWRSLL
jgi:hypothetical protein